MTTAPCLALVNLDWRPASQTVPLGGTATLSLYARATGPGNELISSVDAIIVSDPAFLRLERLNRANAPYHWLTDGFFTPSPDGINNSLTDGAMLYTALARPGMPPLIDTQGLLVMTFEFTAVGGPATAAVTTPLTYGPTAQTHVYDALQANHDIRGAGSSATVHIVASVETLSSVAAAKQLPDARIIRLQIGPNVSRSFSQGEFFYVQDASRAAGIRINPTTAVSLSPGRQLTITGTLATVNQERVVQNAEVTLGPVVSPPHPLGMNISRAIDDPGLRPNGLLVKITGRITHLDQAHSIAYVRDGSLPELRAKLYGFALPPKGSVVSFTGALGADSEGPLLHVKEQNDVEVQDP